MSEEDIERILRDLTKIVAMSGLCRSSWEELRGYMVRTRNNLETYDLRIRISDMVDTMDDVLGSIDHIVESYQELNR